MSTKTLGRPRLPEKEKKQRLSISIESMTDAQLSKWTGKILPKESGHPGLVVDRLVEHGKATDFNPAKK